MGGICPLEMGALFRFPCRHGKKYSFSTTKRHRIIQTKPKSGFISFLGMHSSLDIATNNGQRGRRSKALVI
jgi:hypothetical protein